MSKPKKRKLEKPPRTIEELQKKYDFNGRVWKKRRSSDAVRVVVECPRHWCSTAIEIATETIGQALFGRRFLVEDADVEVIGRWKS